MREYILLSISAILFTILLMFIYNYKSKKTNIDNKIYRFLLLVLLLAIIFEILTVISLNLNGITTLSNILAKINILLTMLWILTICIYVLTLGTAYKIKDYKTFIFKSKENRLMLIFSIISLLTILFSTVDNVHTKTSNYISGNALNLLYIDGVICLITTMTMVIIRKKSSYKNVNFIPLLIIFLESLIAIIVQKIYPSVLLITESFVFKMYLIYFIYENPDLYLIKELEEAKNKVIATVNAKNDLILNISNEIKIPVKKIKQLTSDTEINKNSSDNIKQLNKEGITLLEIINNAMETSQIETEEKRLIEKEYKLEDLITKLKYITSKKLYKKDVEFNIKFENHVGSKFYGDSDKIYLILLNLLSNSVKYTEIGKIKLTIKQETTNNKTFLKFTIYDTGCGIKEENYDKLFKKFSRIDKEQTVEGAGLGLSLIKTLIELLNGTINFESKYGAGTKFIVTIPQIVIDNTPINEKESINTNYKDLSAYKVMLVDNNKYNLEILEEKLSKYKLNIKKITSSSECIKEIKLENKYNLIFINETVDNKNGIDILHTLKCLEDYTIPPTIILIDNNYRKEMIKENKTEYLTKPVNNLELDNIITKYL